jgi:iron-sulfur cluster assembly accessory protein
MAKDKNPNLALRIRVESGGCHGFQYLMSLITMPTGEGLESSTILNEDDSIFQYVPDETESTSPPPNSPKIVLDEPSLELLTGSKVDFTQELIGSQFKIVDNPYASSSCGCGTSFDIKA